MSHASSARLRVVIHGDALPPPDWWARVLRTLPTAASAIACGPCAAAAPSGTVERDTTIAATPRDLRALAPARWPGEHVVLLAAGTQLPDTWCERLVQALALDDVDAASPLDDVVAAHSPVTTKADRSIGVDHLDALCWAYGRRVVLGTEAVSPLLSIWHRDALATAAAGTASAPMRCVVLDHLYVGTGGSGATASTGTAAIAALGELRALLRAALAAAGPAPARAGLDPRPVILHVLHGWGGGAERFVRDLAAADRERVHLVLVARGSFERRRYGEVLQLLDGSFAGPPLRQLVLPRAIADTATTDPDWRAFFDAIVRDCAVDGIVVSSLIGHSLDALRSGLPTLVVGHDCYPLWPLLHRDFGDPALAFDAAQRTRDLATADAGFEFDSRAPAHWQDLRDAYVHALLAARATLAFPSATAQHNVLRLAPELATLARHVVPHGLAAWQRPAPASSDAPSPRDRLRVIVPGRIRRGKGAELLLSALPALREHAEIFLLGAGAEGHALFGESGVHVLLDYDREELPALIARLRPDAALLLPTVAETFSYTLSECWSLGVPVIATRVGALAERIVDGTTGVLVAPDAAALVQAVARIAAQPERLASIRERNAAEPVRTIDAMADDYRRLMPIDAREPARRGATVASIDRLTAMTLAGDLERANARVAASASEQARLRRDLDARAEWASELEHEHRRAATALAALQREYARETARSREDYERLEAEFDERTRWALALDAELNLTRGSLSWRVTRPLRAVTRRLRGLRARLGYLARRMRSAGQRTRGSLQRRGVVGTLRRIVRELTHGRRLPVALAGLPEDDGSPFRIATSETPRVSIVIPVFNKVAYTIACLRSLSTNPSVADVEVIVVDDCSSDDTADRLRDVDGIRVVRNAANLGFVGSCNAGAAIARGEYVAFLNNDTVVTAGWLDALLRCFADEPDAGLVGAKLVYPDGRLQEAGGIVFRDGSGWNYGRFDDPADPRYDFRREADYCSGAAIMVPRALFERLGGFDARYAPAYYEDTDLAFAVRAAGLKVYFEPRATVIHFEGITAGTDTSSGMKRYQVVNREKFVDKWKHVLVRQPAPIDDAANAPLAATFRARRRILIIDACTPTPDHDSGSLRMVNLMRLLRSLGWQVSFFSENRTWMERYTPAIQAIGVEVLYHPYFDDPVTFFRERGNEFDAVLLSRHYVAINYVGLARLYARRAKLIFDTVDLHYLREQREADLSGNRELARKAQNTRTQELKLIRECDVTLVVSPVEHDLLARELPRCHVEVLSNVHEVFGCRRPFSERRDLVFVGSFQHPPNEDAVLWFATDVLPAIRGQLPDVRLHVIGQPAPPSVLALADAAIVVHGYVEDLEPYMDGCRISVAPLRYGAGVKGKVNMAMSYGLPVVATPIAIEGMHVVEGDDVVVANDAARFAAAVIALYGDESRWNTLSRNGLANVQKHFSFDAAKAALQRILA